MMTRDVMRVAAVGDLHYPRLMSAALQAMLAQVGEHADVLLLCGDLTDYGRPEEAQGLARALAAQVKIPMLAVLGNHDYECGKPEEVCQILAEAGIVMLDGETYEIRGVGFAGVKGFGGGFGQGALQPWGEPSIKHFVREAVDEALKLESALAKLQTPQRIALLHYAPIRATIEGEALEVFPFLGSSRLEEPLNRYAVTAVFHGHAHHGSLQGYTTAGVPVYNVAAPLLHKVSPGGPPFRVVEIPIAPL